MKTEIQRVESWGKHALMIFIDGKWEHFHTDYACVVEKMEDQLQRAAKELKRKTHRKVVVK